MERTQCYLFTWWLSDFIFPFTRFIHTYITHARAHVHIVQDIVLLDFKFHNE